MNQIKIIGCGVSGLTTAIVMLEAGYNVQIITDKLPNETTSAKAGAIWFPYAIEPKEQANIWSLESYKKYETLCNIAVAGVSMIDTIILIDKEEDAWWKDAIPKDQIRKATDEEIPNGYHLGYVMNVPLISPPIYLEFLLKQFKRLGGEITVQYVNSIEELNTTENIIVNCTGLGSRELVNDNSMYAIQGQIVKTKAAANINCIIDETERGVMEGFGYVFPRPDALILGGTAVKGNESRIPADKTAQEIIERCQLIEPNLQHVEIESTYVGLRPARPSIRLERNGNIIHNYGHGGAGFTVAWGCAWAVRDLMFNV